MPLSVKFGRQCGVAEIAADLYDRLKLGKGLGHRRVEQRDTP
jgi:hypothetical protein